MTFEDAKTRLHEVFGRHRCDDEELRDAVRRLWFEDVEELEATVAALRARVAELEAWAEKAEVAMVAAERLVRGSWECSEGVLSKRTHRAALADALSACPPLESLTKEVKP
jgi:hypothetical protein